MQFSSLHVGEIMGRIKGGCRWIAERNRIFKAARRWFSKEDGIPRCGIDFTIPRSLALGSFFRRLQDSGINLLDGDAIRGGMESRGSLFCHGHNQPLMERVEWSQFHVCLEVPSRVLYGLSVPTRLYTGAITLTKLLATLARREISFLGANKNKKREGCRGCRRKKKRIKKRNGETAGEVTERKRKYPQTYPHHWWVIWCVQSAVSPLRYIIAKFYHVFCLHISLCLLPLESLVPFRFTQFLSNDKNSITRFHARFIHGFSKF